VLSGHQELPCRGGTKRIWPIVVLPLLLAPIGARAGEPDDKGSDNTEHTVIVGAGAAGELELAGGSFHPGANVMFEWEAVEDWLELEVGASLRSADGGLEAPIDLLVKKPFRLSRWSEFMIGLGPQVVVVSSATTKATYLGGEVALDFMFWPWTRRLGLWIEPDYDFVVRDGVSHGIGGTAGLMLGW
jgi:hypothetical protein